MLSIQYVVEQLVEMLWGLSVAEAVSGARDVVLQAFGGRAPAGIKLRGPGRPPAVLGSVGLRKRRKGPIQLCPVPGCNNRAAPVFGMVCSKHKDLPKGEIKKYREARKAQKAKAKKKG
jgi:hypothetical protein